MVGAKKTFGGQKKRMFEYKTIITGILTRTMDDIIRLTDADSDEIAQELFGFIEKLYLTELASKETRLSLDDYLRQEISYVEPAIQHLKQLLAGKSSCEAWHIEMLFLWTANGNLELFLEETPDFDSLKERIEYWVIYKHLLRKYAA